MTSAVISARLLASDAAKPREKPFEIRDSRLTGFILRVNPTGVRVYFAQVARGKRVKLARVGEMTPDEARDRCSKVLGNVAHGRPPLHDIEGCTEHIMTLGEFIGEPELGAEPAEGTWLHWARVKRRKSWRKTLSAVKRHYSQWFDLPLAAITRRMIDEKMMSRLAAGAAASSVRRDCDALAGILSHAVACELLPVSPMKGADKPKLDRNPKVRFLSVDEERRLRKALADRDASMIEMRDHWNKTRSKRAKLPTLLHFGDHMTPAVLLSMLTGMRRGELLRLRWRDVSPTVITLEETKGVDTRHQPLVKEAKDLLKKLREHCPPTSPDDHVLPVRDNMNKAWITIKKAANLKDFRWNDLRHTFASVIMQEGGNLNTVRELLGHRELRTTLRYAHLGQDDKAKAAALWTNRLKRVSRRDE